MNTDFRLKVGIFKHPKIIKLRRRLGYEGAWSFLVLLEFTAMNHPDGRFPNMTAEDIGIAADYDGDSDEFINALKSLRLIDVGEDEVLEIHDWQEHNPWAAGASRRSDVARAGASAKWGIELAKENQRSRSERLAEARKKGTHTKEEWEQLKEEFNYSCVRCLEQPVELVKDHILPIYQGGSDGIDNIQPLCRRCNSSKGPESSDHRQTFFDKNACSTPAQRLLTPAGTSAPYHLLTDSFPTPSLTDTESKPQPQHRPKTKPLEDPRLLSLSLSVSQLVEKILSDTPYWREWLIYEYAKAERRSPDVWRLGTLINWESGNGTPEEGTHPPNGNTSPSQKKQPLDISRRTVPRTTPWYNGP